MIVPFVVLIAAALGIVALAERGLATLTAQTHEIVRVTAARQAFALQAAAALNSVAADEKNAMLMTDQAGLDIFASAYVSDIEHARTAVAGLKKLAEQPSEMANLDQIEAAIDAYYAAGEELYQLMIHRNFDGAHALSNGKAQAARDHALTLVNKQVAESNQRMADAEGVADALYRRTVRLLMSLSLGGLGCAILMVITITRWLIARPLRDITNAMGELSHGNLDIAIDDAGRRDEIGVLARALRVFREHGIALRERENELRCARDEALFANRSKSEFLANMSHELRTPLNAILGFAAIMGDELFGPLGDRRYKGYAADIHNSGAHLLAIINDILDLAKIDAGHMELQESAVDLAALCDAALAMIGPRALEARVTLRSISLSEPLTIWGDERLLKQALLNLLSNAVKFSHPGSTVTLDLRLADEALEIQVIDHGIGMRDVDIPLVLKPFVQIEGSLQRRYQGTGLGLPLTKLIVELHGGTIAIASHPGQGTTVTLTIPAARWRRMLDEAAILGDTEPTNPPLRYAV